jgi:hypothetical protein
MVSCRSSLFPEAKRSDSNSICVIIKQPVAAALPKSEEGVPRPLSIKSDPTGC